MKTSPTKVAQGTDQTQAEFLNRCHVAAKVMANELRAEHRRWNLPLLSEKNGKIVATKP